MWSDYTTQAEVSLANGIRMDTNYYYWPDTWVNDRPGVFTGSGMPMRFAKTDGTMIDVYQAATQMTDESGQTYPLHADVLLDRALGAEGYYGAFVANMHTDYDRHPGSEAIVLSAQARGVPVISAEPAPDLGRRPQRVVVPEHDVERRPPRLHGGRGCGRAWPVRDAAARGDGGSALGADASTARR